MDPATVIFFAVIISFVLSFMMFEFGRITGLKRGRAEGIRVAVDRQYEKERQEKIFQDKVNALIDERKGKRRQGRPAPLPPSGSA